METTLECRRRKLPSEISINISASDLLEHNLATVLRNALQETGANPRDLKLEMTETGLITEPDRVRRILFELRDLGLDIAIDDFGTGYSSLSYLRDFPVQTIKLDRVFVGTMASQPRHRSIVQSTVALAHELDMRVIAEGPEDMETIELLKQCSCDIAQGFVYARPMPQQEYFDFITAFGNSHESAGVDQQPSS